MYTTNINPWQSSNISPQQQSFAMSGQTGLSSIQPWQTSSFISPIQSSMQMLPQAQSYSLPMQTAALSPLGYNLPFSSVIPSQAGNIQASFIPQAGTINYGFNPNLSWQQDWQQSFSPAMSGHFSQINPQLMQQQQQHSNYQQQMQRMGNMTTGISSTSGYAQPRVELAETNSDVVITAELPNVDPNNIYLTATDDSISISALSHVGGSSSSLHRTVALPTVVRSEHIEANYSNGTLECRIPKSDFVSRRRVKVNVTG